MNTGQMALVIGAFMLFGVVSSNFQRVQFDSANIMGSNSTMQTAITIGRSIIDEISQKPFDACMVNTTKKVFRLTDLTSCGSGTGEYYPNLNDVDDFDRNTFSSPAPGSTPSNIPRCLWGTEGYTVGIRVQYVVQTSPETTSTSYTWAKRITVTITSEYSEYPLTMSHVVTY